MSSYTSPAVGQRFVGADDVVKVVKAVDGDDVIFFAPEYNETYAVSVADFSGHVASGRLTLVEEFPLADSDAGEAARKLVAARSRWSRLGRNQGASLAIMNGRAINLAAILATAIDTRDGAAMDVLAQRALAISTRY